MKHRGDTSAFGIGQNLIGLALPLLIGNIFQQFYNVAGTLIVGHYAGGAAFAALGVAGTVMNLYIFVLNGACVGISVIVASLYGSRDFAAMRRELFLAGTAGTVFTLLLSALSIASLPAVLRAIRTPAEIAPEIGRYLNVILGGLFATYLYNLFAAALRAVGNTRAALGFLVIAVCCNAVLTFVLVAFFGCGIAGAAWATVFSQSLSALLCWLYIRRKMLVLAVGRGDMRCDAALLSMTLRYASVSALHQSSLYIGKLLVQGSVNTLGTASIAAYTAADRIEGVANAFAGSGADAVSIFAAQRTGARDHALARRGFFVGLVLLGALGAFSSAAMFLFARPGITLFMSESAFAAKALGDGVSYLRVVSCFYPLCFIGSAFVGYFRGSGRINIPFIGTTLQIALRVFFSYRLVSSMGLASVALATGIGWTAIVLFQCCVFADTLYRERRRMRLEARADA